MPIVLAQPLSERVDKAGRLQREHPERARELRERGREEAMGPPDRPGWWRYDGADWWYHGDKPKPSKDPV